MAATKLLMDGNPSNLVAGALALRVAWEGFIYTHIHISIYIYIYLYICIYIYIYSPCGVEGGGFRIKSLAFKVRAPEF